MFTLQRNIPVPSTGVSNKSGRARLYPFADMDVNDMFFVPNRKRNNITSHASSIGKKLGRKFATRMVYMREIDDGEGGTYWEMCRSSDEGAVSGIGVWRTE